MNDNGPWLCSPGATAGVLRKHGIRLKKKYGQNFITDENALKKILEAADVGPQDFVLEIGPGIGTLTQYLAENAGRVIAVEIDSSLMPVLGETLSGLDNVTVINGDFMKMSAEEIAKEYNGGRPLKVVANLPYYITTPVIMSILEGGSSVTSVTVLIQKEVAERMTAEAGTKEYGALTLAVSYYSDIEIAAHIPPGCFIPRPLVTSAVVNLKMKKETPPVRDEKLLFGIIRAAFAQRRKTLVNALRNEKKFSLSRDEAVSLIAGCGFDENVRGEALSLEEFIRLADMMAK